MKASLTFEDMPDGTLSMMIYLEGQPDIKSKAHSAVLTLAKEFENHAERLEDPKVEKHFLQEAAEDIIAYHPTIIGGLG